MPEARHESDYNKAVPVTKTLLRMFVCLNSLISHLRSGSTSNQKQKGRNGEDESEHFVGKKAKFAFLKKLKLKRAQ